MTEINKKENLSTQELIQIAKEYLLEVFKYSWVIAIAAAIFGKLMYDRKMSTPTTYTADFSFAFNEAVSENKSSIASLFGGEGGDFISSQGESTLSLSKLQEITKTRKIILKVLFRKVILKYDENKNEDFIINHYLRKFVYTNLNDKNNFYFKTDSIDPYNVKANSLIKYIYSKIIKDHLILDPAVYTMHLKVVSNSEDFSYELVLSLYAELAKHYDEQATEQKRKFYEMAKDRTSELKGQLNSAESNYISYVNSNTAEAGGRNNIMIKTQFLSTDLRNATEAYFAALETTEAAWISYESQKQIPTIIVVDPPLYPLTVSAPNPFLHMILGAVLGGGFIFMLVIGRKFIKDFLSKGAEKDEEDAVLKKEAEKVV